MRYYVNKKDVQDTVDKLNKRQCKRGVFYNIAVKEYKGKKYPADTMVVIEGQVFNMTDFTTQLENFRDTMNLAYDKFQSNDEDLIDKFYRSTFTITFNDKTSNNSAEIKFEMNPETWGLFKNLVEVVLDDPTPYED